MGYYAELDSKQFTGLWEAIVMEQLHDIHGSIMTDIDNPIFRILHRSVKLSLNGGLRDIFGDFRGMSQYIPRRFGMSLGGTFFDIDPGEYFEHVLNPPVGE